LGFVRSRDFDQQRRRYSTLAERREMVALFEKSGLTQAAFAAEHHLTLSTLTRWVRESQTWPAAEEPSGDGTGFQFHSLAFPAAAAWTAEVQLANGATVRLHANTPPELAASILHASR
jgi:transposase-like protein